MDLSHLAPRKALFVAEFAKDMRKREAAIRAGYSERSASQIATELLAEPDVKAAIDAMMTERTNAVKIEAEDVLRRLLKIADADPNDLVQYRRTCCRHCWGEGFGYQRTQREIDRDRGQHERDEEQRRKDLGDTYEPRTFRVEGGTGYRANREPNAECPECFGEGVGDVFVKDTRLLAAGPRALYAGVKRTKDGIEIKTHDKRAVLELIGRHLGMFKDKVEVSGKVDMGDPAEAASKLATLLAAASKRRGGDCPLA